MAVLTRLHVREGYTIKGASGGCTTCGQSKQMQVHALNKTQPKNTPTPKEIETQMANVILDNVATSTDSNTQQTEVEICGATITQWREMTPAKIKNLTTVGCLKSELEIRGVAFKKDMHEIELVKLLKAELTK